MNRAARFINCEPARPWRSVGNWVGSLVSIWILAAGMPLAAQTCATGVPRIAPDDRYTVSELVPGERVVTDEATGLMWMQCSEGQTGAACAGVPALMSWTTALSTANSAVHAGFNDWRLPNAMEVSSLIETGCTSPAINAVRFPGAIATFYWTATTLAGSPGSAWRASFVGGGMFAEAKWSGNGVRLVRGGRTIDAFDAGADYTPDPFSFTPQVNVPLTDSRTSNTITVTGLTTPVGIAVSGAAGSEYSIDGGPFTAAPGTVSNGSTVAVRHTSAATPNTIVVTSLAIGAVSAAFQTTTLVVPTTTTITAITPATGQTVGVPYTVSVSVTGFSPTGTVTVDDGNGNTCPITLPGSNCALTSTTVGTKTITATYSGDTNNTGSADTESYEITAIPPNSPGGVQVGAVTLGATGAGANALTTVTFPQAFGAIPIVIVQASDEDADPQAVRIRNVTRTGFQLLQVEAPGCAGCDGSGGTMTVHWLAAMPGSYRLIQDTAAAPAWADHPIRGSGPGALLKVGAITTAATQYHVGSGNFVGWPLPSWDAVTWPMLSNDLDFTIAPVLLTTVQSWNNEGSNLGPSGLTGSSQPWATSVARNVGTSGFDVAIEASGVAADDTTPAGFAAPGETVGYVAIQSAVSQLLVPLNGPPSVGLVTLGATANGVSCTTVDGVFPTGTSIDNGANYRGFGGKQTRALDLGGWLRRCALSNPNVIANDVRIGMRLEVDEYVPPPIPFPGTNDTVGMVAFSGDLSTTPVTLAKMSVVRQGAALQVDWTTASETGQLGFRLWGRAGSEGEWRLLQPQIVASSEPNARSASRYQQTLADAGEVTEVRLEDVDVLGNSRFHPPIAVGSSRGEEPVPSPIDWAGIRAANAAQPARSPQRGSSPQALVSVRVDGVQRVSADALIAFDGRFAGVAASELALTDGGASVPRHVSCAVLQPGCVIEFLGVARDSRYGPDNAYLLDLSPASASAVGPGNTRVGSGTRRVYPETLRFEPNLRYSDSTPAADPWYDAYLSTSGAPRELTRTFSLPDRSDGEVTLKAEVWGAFDFPGPDPDHHVELYLNDTLIADRHFDGYTAEVIEVSVPPALLAATNTLRLRIPRDTGFSMDAVMFDGFRVRYPRQSRVVSGELFEGEIDPRATTAGDSLHASGFETDTFSGFQLDGQASGAVLWSVVDGELRRDELAAGSVLVDAATSAWRVADPARIASPELAQPAAGYALPPQLDYLVVTHPQFESGLAPLLALQASRGLNTVVLRTDEIYAAHSDHERDPQAIKTAIAAARQRGARFVLLAGGDSWDYHDYLGLDSQGFVPTWYRPVNRVMHHAATDHPYVDLDDDGRGELAIGRLPVRTLDELDRIVASIVARGNTIASRYLGVAGLSAPGERFGAHTRASLSYLRQPGQLRDFALADEIGTATARTRTHAGLAGTADWLSYLGHSSWNRWAFDNLLDVSQLGAITRTGLPAIVSQWTCLTNDFAIPVNDTMAHALMLRPNRLASAVLGATTIVEDASHLALATRFFDLVEDGRLGNAGGLPTRTLGEALNAAKSDLVTREPAHASAALSIVLFGDPAAPLIP